MIIASYTREQLGNLGEEHENEFKMRSLGYSNCEEELKVLFYRLLNVLSIVEDWERDDAPFIIQANILDIKNKIISKVRLDVQKLFAKYNIDDEEEQIALSARINMVIDDIELAALRYNDLFLTQC